MSPSKGANSENTTTNNPLMGHNRSSRRNTPQPPILCQSWRIWLNHLWKPPIPQKTGNTNTPLLLAPHLRPLQKNPDPMPHKPNTPVLETMGTGITSNTTQPRSMTQTKTPRALSRLLPHNQPCLKELIPTKDLYSRAMGWGKEM